MAQRSKWILEQWLRDTSVGWWLVRGWYYPMHWGISVFQCSLGFIFWPSNIACWKIPEVNRGSSWENHRSMVHFPAHHVWLPERTWIYFCYVEIPAGILSKTDAITRTYGSQNGRNPKNCRECQWFNGNFRILKWVCTLVPYFWPYFVGRFPCRGLKTRPYIL